LSPKTNLLNFNTHFSGKEYIIKYAFLAGYKRKKSFKCDICPLPPVHGATAPSEPGPPHYRGFTITLRHTTLSRTPLDELSARRSDLYLTPHNVHHTETSMSRRDSKPKSLQASGCRPTPLGSA
jgi:hypothetical protein